jgi:UTP-glucose-1-phosphate uridylyltransferase
MIKVVITAAGKGTRLLPFTKEIPKEMILWVKNLSKIKILNDISIRVIDKKK